MRQAACLDPSSGPMSEPSQFSYLVYCQSPVCGPLALQLCYSPVAAQRWEVDRETWTDWLVGLAGWEAAGCEERRSLLPSLSQTLSGGQLTFLFSLSLLSGKEMRDRFVLWPAAVWNGASGVSPWHTTWWAKSISAPLFIWGTGFVEQYRKMTSHGLQWNRRILWSVKCSLFLVREGYCCGIFIKRKVCCFLREKAVLFIISTNTSAFYRWKGLLTFH